LEAATGSEAQAELQNLFVALQVQEDTIDDGLPFNSKSVGKALPQAHLDLAAGGGMKQAGVDGGAVPYENARTPSKNQDPAVGKRHNMGDVGIAADKSAIGRTEESAVAPNGACVNLNANKRNMMEGRDARRKPPTAEATVDGVSVSIVQSPRLPVVTRKELRAMPQLEQERFCAAICQMMETPGEERQSEFFRIASYNGCFRTKNCHHGQETFPAWNRAYMSEFEQALRRADMLLGGDGNIGLPYWDWSRESVNGEVLPAIIREMFAKPPQALVMEMGELMGSRFLGGYRRRDDDELRWRLQGSDVAAMAKECLEESMHWKHASTRWGGRTSIETLHNRVHVALGWPMSSVEFAPFDPVFWLHHCNLDRIYERYLTLHADSESEMSTTQKALHEEHNEPNRFLEELTPFKHPATMNPAMPKDAFAPTEAMGFSYDELPPLPDAKHRAAPVLALFSDIPIAQIPDVSTYPHRSHLNIFIYCYSDLYGHHVQVREFTVLVLRGLIYSIAIYKYLNIVNYGYG
jgi:hypothetical protein